MDPQFQELAQHIADDVVKRFDGVFAKRLGEAEKYLGDLIDRRLGETEKRLGDVIDKRLDEAEKRLSHNFIAAEERLSAGAKMNMEELRSEIKRGAEGYGATLERIERQLTELNAKVDAKFGDHTRVLANHNQRIAKLERNSG